MPESVTGDTNFGKVLPGIVRFFWNTKTGWSTWDDVRTFVDAQELHLNPEFPAVRFGGSMFEAFTLRNGRIFRLKDHYERLCYGARKLCMPEPEWDSLLRGVKELAKIHAPKLQDGQALYFFPILMNISTGSLKAFEDTDYVLVIKCCYLQPKRDAKSTVFVDIDHIRTNPEFGDVKFAGNYAMVKPWQRIAEKNGCTSVLFTDYQTHSHFTELATSNIFFASPGKELWT